MNLDGMPVHVGGPEGSNCADAARDSRVAASTAALRRGTSAAKVCRHSDGLT
jgi:hypothetical protein